jgi:RES domain-containing protein
VKITAWRIVRSRNLDDAFTGEGARRYPGRWNLRGVPMVYMAGNLSLAALEMLVHLDSVDEMGDYHCIPIYFEKHFCHAVQVGTLPQEWADDPIPDCTRELGSHWATKADSAILAVPSAIVPVEMNYLLNPRHADFLKLEIGTPEKFRMDPRLFKSQSK